AHASGALYERNINYRCHISAHRAMRDLRNPGANATFDPVEPGPVRDDPNQPADCPCAIERPLRSLEQFDCRNVVKAKIGIGTIMVDLDMVEILRWFALTLAMEA